MSLNPAQNAAIESIKSLYLNPNGADVWFIIVDERIPAHKHILSAMCPYYETMFYGSLPETGDVDLSASNITVESFKEFLKFVYLLEPKLTMDNMEDVMSLAKQSLSTYIFDKCDEFVKDSLTFDNIFLAYQLALLYDSRKLKEFCEGQIYMIAEEMFTSSSFLTFPHGYLLDILKSDSLACEEIHIFNASIVWARAACKRNNTNPCSAQDLRYQLRDAVYQIRFTSMTKEEAATCINQCPGLFSVDELQEIFNMIAHKTTYQPKLFNWTPRYFNLEMNKDRTLECARIICHRAGPPYYTELIEITKFKCNRRVILTGLTCENDASTRNPIQITIREINSNGDISERYNEPAYAAFNIKFETQTLTSYLAYVKLNKTVFIRPNYSYEIQISIGSVTSGMMKSYRYLKKKVRVDHDIIFNFTQNRGFVSSLHINRFDNKTIFRKIIYDPTFWFTFLCFIGVCIFMIYAYI